MVGRFFFGTCLFLFALAARAEDVPIISGYGAANPDVPELAQYSFFLGEWRVDMNYFGDDGNWHAVPDPAHVKTFFHADGRTLQTIFTTPGGFFSTDIRSYDAKAGVWRVQFLNAKSQRWHSFTSKWEKDKMVTQVPGGFGGDGPDIRSEMRDISDAGFASNVFAKRPDGTWLHTYKLNYVRLTK
ncbi:MAG: hypothetical protein HWE25_16405 [Alphaproteobacteria bacterium]|nr:hypothetical protein [Alphaproteobacteria bacterium]